MIIVELKGGLGNQMFQYAAARALTTNDNPVYLDHRFLKDNHSDTEHFTARDFALDIFKNIKVKQATGRQRELFKSNRRPYRIARKLTDARYVRQQGSEFVPFDGFTGSKFLYLDGYFQSEKYFRNIRTELLHEFAFPPLDAENQKIKDHIIKAPHAVSVHIRRGDYLKSDVIANVHPVVPLSYYQQAINRLTEKYPAELFVFSDDQQWAKDNIRHSTLPVNFVQQLNPVDSWKDMALMTYCRHHIIANSSFSWWGAWLSQLDGEKFAPHKWFNSASVDYNIHDFVPDSWQILTYDA